MRGDDECYKATMWPGRWEFTNPEPMSSVDSLLLTPQMSLSPFFDQSSLSNSQIDK
jgi:hypothetical protein